MTYYRRAQHRWTPHVRQSCAVFVGMRRINLSTPLQLCSLLLFVVVGHGDADGVIDDAVTMLDSGVGRGARRRYGGQCNSSFHTQRLNTPEKGDIQLCSLQQ